MHFSSVLLIVAPIFALLEHHHFSVEVRKYIITSLLAATISLLTAPVSSPNHAELLRL